MLVDTLDRSISVGLEDAQISTEPATFLQLAAKGVERALPKGWAVHPANADAMSVTRVIESAIEHGSDRLVVIPMQPQFARASTGRMLQLIYRTLANLAPDLHLEVRTSWFDDVEYISAIAELVRATIEREGLDEKACRVLLSPREPLSTDQTHVDQCVQTARLVAQKLDWLESRVGVFDDSMNLAHDWHPELESADEAANHLIVVPMGLSHQTLDLERHIAESIPPCGMTFHACDAGEASERLVKIVSTIARRGRHSAPSDRPTHRPTNAPSQEEVIGELFGVGVSIPGAVCSPADAAQQCSTEDFLAIKRPHLEALALLRDARVQLSLPECWLFNTCHRFELYGWFPAGMAQEAREELLRKVAAMVGRDRAEATRTMRGVEAWRHLLRTAAGLNSGLVGDADVTEQLESGLRAAQYAGTAGPRSAALVDRAMDSVRKLRHETSWGKYTHRYTEIALASLPEDVQESFSKSKITIMGGSTTAVSLLEVLRERYGVRPERVTVVYRGNRSGPLMNRFLAAVGEDRMRRVENYYDDAVLHDVAGSDVAFLAADHREPVCSGHQLATIREKASLPLTVVDFNTFGSIRDSAIPALQVFDAATIADKITAFNEQTQQCPAFPRALAAAEEWISRHTHSHRAKAGATLIGASA